MSDKQIEAAVDKVLSDGENLEVLPNGVEGYITYGSPGGGYADPPDWVPDDIKKEI